MRNADTLPTPPDGEQLPKLRGGGATGPDPLPTVRAAKRRASPRAVAGKEVARVATGREDIELAVAASGLRLGDRVTMTGAISFLSATSAGAVWMTVRLDGERGHHVDIAARDIEQKDKESGT